MRIRTRLTLWYAVVMFASLTLMGVLSYQEFVRDPELRASWQVSRRFSRGDRREPSLARNHNPFHDVAVIIVWAGVPAALLALVGGWFFMREAFVPVEKLTLAAERINERNLRERLQRTGNGDELDRLTEVFNAMTARLDQSFQRIREFTLHASHELKTPLTVMHGELETALREEEANGVQRERLLSQLDEVDRLANIVDALSLLTKADAGQVAVELALVPMHELVRDAVEDAQHLAQGRDVEVSLTSCDELNVQGDRHRLRQLLLNLTDNAIKYNRADGTATVSLRRLGREAELAITNTGPGIPLDQVSRVFDRFFRGDASHGHTVEGCGLGLSIAQWIVQAHGGTIRMESDGVDWTSVTVRLPATTAE